MAPSRRAAHWHATCSEGRDARRSNQEKVALSSQPQIVPLSSLPASVFRPSGRPARVTIVLEPLLRLEQQQKK